MSRRCWSESRRCTGPGCSPTPSSRSTAGRGRPVSRRHFGGAAGVAARGEIIAADELPFRYAGFSTCFRREAGAAGKDTRGIFRVHQFDKVEMFCFVVPEEGQAEHERLLAIEESILQELELPYRVVAIAVNDLGASAAMKYDCEAWLPGQARYRELTSCRIRPTISPSTGHPLPACRGPAGDALHAERDSGRRGRTIIALLENGQQDDGRCACPAALVPTGCRRFCRRPISRRRAGGREAGPRGTPAPRAGGPQARSSRAHPDAERVPGPDGRW